MSEPLNEQSMPRIGDVIAGKYRLEQVAGEGGMGIVYAAEHLVLKQRVAVKIMLPQAARSEAIVERFSREAQATARIQSDHVARVLDAGSLANGAPFLVMEYLEGCDLEELLQLHGKLPVVEVVDYALQACEALAHAHTVGIVHRDLKPANLFLASRPSGGSIVKMLDFGISKSMRSKPSEKKLTGAHVLGSPVYISPEQLRNAKTIDARADIWSLGIVVYEMLTGTTPFDGDGVGEIFAAILEKDAEPLHVRNPKVPRELSDVIAKCIKREPDERWADAGEVARALAPFGSGGWANVVLRIDQLFARARMLRAFETPIETRIVVDAIAAAAERAKTGARSLPPPAQAPPPPSGPKPIVVDTIDEGDPPGAGRRGRKVVWAVVAGVTLVAIAAAGIVGTTRARSEAEDPQETASAVSAAVADSPPAEPSPEPASLASNRPAPPVASSSASAAKASAAAAPRSKARSKKKRSTGQRPSFLKTSQ